MKQFGYKESDQTYVDRPSAYIILFEGSDRLVSVRHRGKLFLPGGGIDHGESVEEALHRELKEEIGWTAKLGPEIAVAGQFATSPKYGKAVNKICHFFLGDAIEKSGSPIEPDHELYVASIEKFVLEAAHESFVWAIKLALERRANDR